MAAVGENVDGLHEGDRVVGLTRFGAYASHINVAPKYLRPFPNNWSFTEAAAYPVQVLLSIPRVDMCYLDTSSLHSLLVGYETSN